MGATARVAQVSCVSTVEMKKQAAGRTSSEGSVHDIRRSCIVRCRTVRTMVTTMIRCLKHETFIGTLDMTYGWGAVLMDAVFTGSAQTGRLRQPRTSGLS